METDRGGNEKVFTTGQPPGHNKWDRKMTDTPLYYDQSRLLRVFAGDEDFLSEMIHDFLEKIPSDMARLKKAIEDINHPEVELLAHTVNGLCGTFYAKSSKDTAAAIESAARLKNHEPMESLFHKLEAELSKLCKELRRDFTPDKGAA